jgi:hypothetical protein
MFDILDILKRDEQMLASLPNARIRGPTMVKLKGPNRTVRMTKLSLARRNGRNKQRSVSFKSSLVLPDEGRVEEELDLSAERG